MEVRPTKKQRELLSFIDTFISGHGYGPSYREIMVGLGYKSVATVALHVDNLITKGYLRKREGSARSLEVVDSQAVAALRNARVKPAEERWLVELVQERFQRVESAEKPSQALIDELYVLVGALKILGFEGAANSFIQRLTKLKRRAKK